MLIKTVCMSAVEMKTKVVVGVLCPKLYMEPPTHSVGSLLSLRPGSYYTWLLLTTKRMNRVQLTQKSCDNPYL